MSKHTPGPWTVAGWQGICVNAPNGNTLVLCPQAEPRQDIQTIQANARLIAAAPDLLAALNRIVPWLGKMIADKAHLNAVAPNDAIGALQQAEAALAKAKGVSNAKA